MESSGKTTFRGDCSAREAVSCEAVRLVLTDCSAREALMAQFARQSVSTSYSTRRQPTQKEAGVDAGAVQRSS